MKKKKLFFLTLACLTAASALFALTSCGDKPEEGQGGKDPVEHTHVVEIVAGKEATCTETGLTEGQKCSECGETIKAQEIIPAMGHDWNDGEVTTQATCTAEGVITYTCANCGETKTESVEKIAHTAVEVPVVKATCFETGLTAGEKCSVCGEILKEQEVVPTTTHNYVVTTDVAATCTESGYVVYRCENCGDSYSVSSPAVGHNYVDGVCTVCGESDPDEQQTYSKGLEFTLSSDKTSYIVSGIGTCTDTDIVISSEYNGLPVTSIGDSAFQNCTNITSITIPKRVTSIGDDAFSGCYNLQYNEFDNAKYLGNNENPYVVLIKTKSTSINSCEIHQDTKIIYKSAFLYCRDLASITIPDSVTSVGSHVFDGCRSLTRVTFGNNSQLTSIGHSAFQNCSELTSVTIPDSVTRIIDNAFIRCNKLSSVTFSDNSQLTSIGSLAFSGCSVLTSITIPDGVTSIGSYAFQNCSSLASVDIPSSVTSIGDYAFSGCNSLHYNEFDNAKYLGNKETPFVVLIMANSTSITSCEIHQDTKIIYSSAFLSCSNLTSIAIPEGVTSIGANAFAGCSRLTSIAIPDSVTSIRGAAFNGCNSLTSITIPNGVSSIETWTFYCCSSLATITIPDTVKYIGDLAFYNCWSLTSITIPNSVETIINNPFSECINLKKILVDEGNTNYKSVDGVLFTIDGRTLISYPVGDKRTAYIIPEGVTSIANSAFAHCNTLTSITIPDSVTSIEGWAFDGCSSLTSITIPEGVTSIANHAFAFCSSLTSITIPDSVTSIGDWAFVNCNSLTSVNVDENNVNYQSIDGVLFTKDGNTLIVYPIGNERTEYTIPEGVTNIGNGAFSTSLNCSKLTSITIPNSVTSIGSEAFFNYSSLTTVKYTGSEEDWAEISIAWGNDYLTGATIVYNYQGE